MLLETNWYNLAKPWLIIIIIIIIQHWQWQGHTYRLSVEAYTDVLTQNYFTSKHILWSDVIYAWPQNNEHRGLHKRYNIVDGFCVSICLDVVTDSDNCLQSEPGGTYNGTAYVTSSGRICRPWSSRSSLHCQVHLRASVLNMLQLFSLTLFAKAHLSVKLLSAAK